MRQKTERNKEIRRYYKPGLGPYLGKLYGISRQRVHQIVHVKRKNWFIRGLEYLGASAEFGWFWIRMVK